MYAWYLGCQVLEKPFYLIFLKVNSKQQDYGNGKHTTDSQGFQTMM
jgi:hypothetical protein